ncbi:hypothetical protein SAZ11_29390 [Streptomyces sp. FXJ1.4098]|nr:hypothetical protein [Streptomyces sp. FXJ1.4098]MDW6061385.1 hypothetical protein [Streptomyces sp. FXJ1.4098]
MTTQTQQTTGPTAQQQGTHHFILTLQIPDGSSGFMTATFNNTLTPPADATRADIYEALRGEIAQAHPNLKRANVLFFSLEPNRLWPHG